MDIKIDEHKLNYHPYAVGCWMKGNRIFPICIEISPSGACNHRCAFCSQSYLGYQNRYIDTDNILAKLVGMYQGGTRSVVLAGEGEPMLHPEIEKIVSGIKQIGLDVAMSSNGALFYKEKAEKILPSLTWIRFSFNGHSPHNYAMVHGTNGDIFDVTLKNISDAVRIKEKSRLSVTIGIQYVLYHDNWDIEAIEALICKFRDMGVDYFSIKPFSIHPLSHNIVKPCDFDGFETWKKIFESYATNDFEVFVRSNAIRNLSETKKYPYCLGIPFWSYVDSAACVWPCLAFIGVDGFSLGDLKKQEYVDIIKSDRYSEIVSRIEKMDISKCRKSCRLDSINEYLWKLKKGVEHINFI